MMKNIGYKFCNAKIEDIWYIFMGLSETTFSSVEIAIGTKGTLQLSCEAMMSAMETLETIDFCCSRRAYADAFTLIRKLRDDIMQYLFLLATIKRKTGITDEECEEFIFDEENIIKIIEYDFQVRMSGERKEDVDFALEAWLTNELDGSKSFKYRKKFYDTSKYIDFLEDKYPAIKYLMDNFFSDIWKDSDRILNNYVHANGSKYIYANYILNLDNEKINAKVEKVIVNIVVVFLCCLTIIDSTKLSSLDYLDALDLGLTPQEDSQYWVMHSIVAFFANYVDERVIDYIQEQECYGMKLKASFYDDLGD